MGRTLRQRRKRTPRKDWALNSSEDWIAFIKFLRKYGFTASKHLIPAQFANSGRGIKTLKVIEKGEVILNVPKELLITPKVVDKTEHSQYLRHFKGSQKLTCFLLLEKQMKDASVWFPYISSLPNDFSFHPVWNKIPPNLIQMMPRFMANEILRYYKRVESDYQDAEQILKVLTKLSSEELYSEYLWAWICVNSRSVYCDIDGTSERQDCCALVPFLDLLNHSCSVETKANYSVPNECFSLTTNTAFRKYDEVLICYGEHSNLNLYLEYGFTLEQNNNNVLSFNVSDLLEMHKKKDSVVNLGHLTNFMKMHNLSDNFFINEEGLSWNLDKLILLLNSKYVNHHRLMYGGQNNEADQLHQGWITSFVKSVLDDVNNALDSLVQYSKFHFHPCINDITRILKDYKKILDGK